MKHLKFLQIAVFMIALFSMTANNSWAQTTITLPQACDCPSGGGGTGPDADGDGVADANDLCPGTPAGIAVDATGCPTGPFPAGYVACNGVTTVVQDVTSATGRVWMDRNLGASQVATSSTDAASYGDLYQWGRFADGHQCRTSGTTTTNATTAVPNAGNSWNGLFIIEIDSPFDWLTPQNTSLWQGVSGTNNPCPSGYRVPTINELNTERLSWSSNNAAGAFASPLKLTMGGRRQGNAGNIAFDGTDAEYASSTIAGTSSQFLSFSSGTATDAISGRNNGTSIRCIKN